MSSPLESALRSLRETGPPTKLQCALTFLGQLLTTFNGRDELGRFREIFPSAPLDDFRKPHHHLLFMMLEDADARARVMTAYAVERVLESALPDLELAVRGPLMDESWALRGYPLKDSSGGSKFLKQLRDNRDRARKGDQTRAGNGPSVYSANTKSPVQIAAPYMEEWLFVAHAAPIGSIRALGVEVVPKKGRMDHAVILTKRESTDDAELIELARELDALFTWIDPADAGGG